MTTQHHKNQHHHEHHATHASNDEEVSPAEMRRRKRMKSMGIVAVVLMLLALLAYVLSDNERLAPGSEGQGFQTKKELVGRRTQAFHNVMQRIFRIYKREAYGDRVTINADGSLDRDDYDDRFLDMIRSLAAPDATGRVDEELADMIHEVYDLNVPLLLEVLMTRKSIAEVGPMMCAYWQAWAQAVSLSSSEEEASRPSSRASSFAVRRRWTQKVHFSITPISRVTTSGLSMRLKDSGHR